MPEDRKNDQGYCYGPFFFPSFPQNMMDGFSLHPTGKCIMELKPWIVEFHIDLFSRPWKMTLIILHSRQEGSTQCGLVAPWTNMAAQTFLCLFTSFQQTCKWDQSIRVYHTPSHVTCMQMFCPLRSPLPSLKHVANSIHPPRSLVCKTDMIDDRRRHRAGWSTLVVAIHDARFTTESTQGLG